MRDLPQNFVEGDTQGEIGALGNCRARLLPLVQRVEFLDTLNTDPPHFFLCKLTTTSIPVLAALVNETN